MPRSILQSRAAGIALMIAGLGLGVWGYQMSQSLVSEISQAVTGAYTDKVMALYIGGAASFIVGLYVFAKR